MSVIIKGVKLPNYCWECFCNDESHWCNLLEQITPYEDEKLKDCPLEEVKERAEINVFDKREVHHNCIVEVWENSVTGECSIGWYKDENNY